MPPLVIALAGRRIDAPDDGPPAFALVDVPLVSGRLRALIEELRPVAIVCSAACGADLLALLVAGELGIRRRVVLPFDTTRFRATSVTDRPGAHWGQQFDEVINAVRASNDLVVLPGGEDADAAYAAASASILDEARAIASEDGTVVAVVVWEGERQSGLDMTADFARAAAARGCALRVVHTLPRRFTHIASVEQARRVLNNEAVSPKDAVRLCRKLRTDLAYWYAREVAERVRVRPGLDDEDSFELLRVQVTCTYKDLSLPTEKRLASAVRLLREAGFDPDKAKNPEILGLAGAIHKRWWQHDGQRFRIERALRYYRRAYGADVTVGDGYPAVNAALCLDHLAIDDLGAAREAMPEDVSVPIDQHVLASVSARQQDARRIRSELVERLPLLVRQGGKGYLATDWWYHATMAEAYLGLDEYDAARDWLERGTRLPGVEDWQYEATATQLASLARLRHQLMGAADFDENAPAWQAIREGFGSLPVAGAHSALVGRMGVALSGGGFRASLYHIGLLARLAELDVLRDVEVLSCVSGGSIIGALYYLHVRHLLETTPDDQITREHYVSIVRQVQREFLRGVQTNIRSQVFSNIGGAFRNAFSSSYSQTAGLGELFEETFYATVPDGEGSRPRWLVDLYVEPARSLGERYDRDRPFNPRLENWRRCAKVPILILNATTLNTGHAWQFTTSWMGEPAARGDLAVSRVPQLGPIRYEDAPDPYKRVRLGHAVAASAAVPGLFDPLLMPGLFTDLTIRLADGGVHDNQGTASLLDQECSVLVVSDGSGQLSLADDPGAGRVGVPLRANDVLMARVRELEIQLISALHRATMIRTFAFVHLTYGLVPKARRPADSRLPADRTVRQRTEDDGLFTPYGMRRDMQERLATLRTDLDAFSDLEAYGLMVSAYLATRYEWSRASPGFPRDQSTQLEWSFNIVRPLVASEDGKREAYLRTAELLEVGRRRMWKELAFAPSTKWIATALGRAFSEKPGRKKVSERAAALVIGMMALPSRLHRRFGTPRWLELGKINGRADVKANSLEP